MKYIRPWLPAFIIFCLALFVRIVYNLTVSGGYYPLYDSLAYQSIGFNILDEHCYCLHPFISTVYRAPLWPFLIAGLSLIFGRADIVDRLFLCVLDSLTCVLIYLFVRDLFTRRTALIAGIIASLYSALFIYDGWMYTEALFTFFLMAVCYTIYRIQRQRGAGLWKWILCGILLALLALTRPNGIIILALVVLWALFMVWRKYFSRAALLHVSLALLVSCALIAPWTIRNALVAHAFIPVATGDGTVLMGSYNDIAINDPDYQGSWRNPLIVNPQLLQPFPLYTCQPTCEVQREDVSKDAAITWIKAHLNEIPELWSYHFLRFWTPDTQEADMSMYRFHGYPLSKDLQIVARISPIFIFVLATLGLFTTVKKYWRELLFIYGVILITFGEALAYYGSSRFRAPIEPLLVILASAGIWWLTSSDGLRKYWPRREKYVLTEEREPLQPVEQV